MTKQIYSDMPPAWSTKIALDVPAWSAERPARPYGIDVSNHQGSIDWKAVAASGCKFAFLKCTEGTTFVDAQYSTNVRGCAEAGIYYSPYHYLLPQFSTAAQVSHFLLHLGPTTRFELQPACDFEEARGKVPSELAAIAGSFVRGIYNVVGAECILYVNRSWWTMLNLSPDFQHLQIPLWIAAWAAGADLRLSPAKPYTFWQFSSTGTVPGVRGPVDLNLFNGTFDNLKKFALMPPGVGDEGVA